VLILSAVLRALRAIARNSDEPRLYSILISGSSSSKASHRTKCGTKILASLPVPGSKKVIRDAASLVRPRFHRVR